MMLAARGTRGDLEDAVALWRRGLARTRRGSHEWALACGQLAQGLYEMFTAEGDVSELDEAERLLGGALGLLPRTGRGDVLRGNYAIVLSTRHQVVRPDPGGLDRAIGIFEDLIRRKADPSAPELPGWAATHLAQALVNRYTDRSDPADLARARELGSPPDGSTVPGSRLAASAAIGADIQATVAMYEYLTDARQADVDQAIHDQQRAVDQSGDDPVRRGPTVINLATTLAMRHYARRDAAPTHPSAGSGDIATDLTRALELLRGLRTADTPVPYRGGAMALHGMLLMDRYMTDPGRYAADPAMADQLLSSALELPMDYRSRIGARLRLAYSRLAIAHSTGDANGLDAAVALMRGAVSDIPPQSPLHAGALGCLADVLQTRAQTTGMPEHQREGTELCREICRNDADSDRAAVYLAARGWAQWAWRRGAMDEVAEAGRIALPLLYDIAALQLGREGKAVPLRQADRLSARTAFALVAVGQSAAAAIALETGRALMLGEVMQREHPDLLSLMDSDYHNLVSRFRRAAERLTSVERRLLFGPQDAPVIDGARESYRARLDEMDDVVQDIRRLPGFGTFLRPPALADLTGTAASCRSTLVYLAATDRGGVALVVPRTAAVPPAARTRTGPGTEVTAVPLPRLTTDFEQSSVAALRLALERDVEHGDRDAAERSMDELTGRLWKSVMEPVVQAVGSGTDMVLIPDGPLGTLPLHAAAYPDPSAPTGRRFVIDDLPVAMAPSARTLSIAVARTPAPVHRVLAVRDPRPSSEVLLPGAVSEIERIRDVLPPSVRVLELHGAAATRQGVQQALVDVQICHFACHAHAYPDRPLDGGLSLAGDASLTVRDMFAMPSISARLAVLSACDSGRFDETLPEEVVGLATGFFQAGFAAVLAALWPLEDAPAAAQMALTYRHWLSDGMSLPAAVRSAMVWIRDSTNGQKAAAFPELDFAPGDPAATADAEWLSTRDHSSPLVWAAFVCLGI